MERPSGWGGALLTGFAGVGSFTLALLVFSAGGRQAVNPAQPSAKTTAASQEASARGSSVLAKPCRL